MANPFGEVVDNYKLDDFVEYIEKKTQEDRAREAKNLINENGKSTKAEEYVRGLKKQFGNGITAHCMVYNGTGDTLRFVGYREQHGFIGRTPYPLVIGNGQWVSFLHVKTTAATQGTTAAVVYRGKNASGQERDFYFAWRVPWAASKPTNRVLCEVGPIDSFGKRWDELFKRLNKTGRSDNRGRYC